MIKKHYTGMERRAENIIWNAAGRYDFDPPFLAFFENGSPDFYFNMVIGLAVRYLDMERLEEFFESYAGFHRAEEADELLWLGIENCVYEKELKERPYLGKLRRNRAEAFYRTRETLSRQQMMLQSMLVYDQMEARWASVLGRKSELLGPRGEALKKNLLIPGDFGTGEVIERMRKILKECFHFDPDRSGRDAGNRAGVRSQSVLRHLLHRESRYRDTLIVRNGSSEGDREGSAQLAHEAGRLKSARDYEQDLLYIRGSLGECSVSEQDLRMLENNLCKGAHALCRLYVTDGTGRSREGENAAEIGARDRKDLERVRKEFAAQAGRNRAWQKKHAEELASGIRRLSARIDEVLSDYEQAVPEEAKSGVLRPDIAYRLPVLRDPDVFLKRGEETERSVTVDLLLDASASRLNYQEQLAAEAEVIAKSCMEAGIPVQVSSFRSLRGFTVLQVLKNRDSRDTGRIVDYTAGGWNRDGLGLRLAAEFLPKRDDALVRILLVLTDASPNDSTPMSGSGMISREYQGRAAILDAREAVAEIRKSGVKTAAIFLGPTLYMENLHAIYGADCVRIHKIGQLEEAVGTLLEMLMREQTGISEPFPKD